jgi:hypothetical protein
MENSTFDYYAAAINIKLEETPAKIPTTAKAVGKAWGHSRKCPLAIHNSKVILVSKNNKEFFGTILEKKFIPADDRYQTWEFKSTQKTIQSIINEITK